jgi:hypothetical protein
VVTDTKRFSVIVAIATFLIMLNPVATVQAQGTFFKPIPPAPASPTPTSPTSPGKKKKPAVSKPRSGPGQSSPGVPDTAQPKSASSTITGAFQGIDADGSIKIENRTARLAGIILRHDAGDVPGLAEWVQRNGGEVRCDPAPVSKLIADPATAPTDYTCRVGDLDIGLALIVNGAAVMSLDAPASYIEQATLRTARDRVARSVTSADFPAFLAGTYEAGCQSFGCTMRWVSNYHTSEVLFAEQDWKGLAENALSVGFREDINYYWLGRAAEALGSYKAAATYYEKAMDLNRNGNNLDHCAIASTDNCGNINFVPELPGRYRNAMSMANYFF